MTRYIFVTGGVLSALGKGIAASSIAALLQRQGFRVRIRKSDPYINFDSGTMNPYQHGEVFVTEDGVETDLDLGHYERFTGVRSTGSDNTTTGRIYYEVIEKERRGEYGGETVQVIPHITDAIKRFITYDADHYDFIICEIGGTVGDIEALPYIEAIRQLGYDWGWDRCLYIHLTLVPYVPTAQELKTKPSQHSVQSLLSSGIQPGMLLCRSPYPLPEGVRDKLARFCNISKARVFDAVDVPHTYEVPLRFHEQGLEQEICRYFKIDPIPEINLDDWKDLVHRLKNPHHEVKIALIGKYAELPDAYKSLIEALTHAGIAQNTRVLVDWVSAEDLTRDNVEQRLAQAGGILVPGGFGSRGVEGKILAIEYARVTKTPYLGICLGVQLMVVEFARHVLGLKDAHSREFDSTTNVAVVDLMTEWETDKGHETRSSASRLGGTLRLGLYPCELTPGSLAQRIYGEFLISERHRHRYEVNMAYRESFERAGLHFSGLSPDGFLPEIIENKNHPWMVGVQFHPEFCSTLFKAHPLLFHFIQAARGDKR